MPELADLEVVVTELLEAFEINIPPVPVESMLQKPPSGMWKEVDITQISGNFLKITDTYSPRMSMARLLARHIVASEWGKARELGRLSGDEDGLYTFARMVIMPKSMVDEMSAGAKTPTAMRLHFEVPEEDAQLRLQDLARYG